MTEQEIAAWSLGLTAVCALGTWVAVPQIQSGWESVRNWLSKRSESSGLTVLGNLEIAKPYFLPLPTGIAKADRGTLEYLLEQLPSYQMHWLHEKDFGNAFSEKKIEKVQSFSWNHDPAEREFLDPELESMRYDLKRAAQEFVYYVGLHTDPIFPGADNDARKIPDQYDNQNRYSDRLFFSKAKEINDAAEKAWGFYQALIRRARLKLALSDTEQDES